MRGLQTPTGRVGDSLKFADWISETLRSQQSINHDRRDQNSVVTSVNISWNSDSDIVCLLHAKAIRLTPKKTPALFSSCGVWTHVRHFKLRGHIFSRSHVTNRL